jgi:hypothetical protein
MVLNLRMKCLTSFKSQEKWLLSFKSLEEMIEWF